MSRRARSAGGVVCIGGVEIVAPDDWYDCLQVQKHVASPPFQISKWLIWELVVSAEGRKWSCGRSKKFAAPIVGHTRYITCGVCGVETAASCD
jgi:hypothetical protein